MPVATDRLTAGENLFPLPSEPCLQRALNSFGVALARSNPSLLVRGGERLGHFSGPFRATPFPLVEDLRTVLAVKGSLRRATPARPCPLRAVLSEHPLPRGNGAQCKVTTPPPCWPLVAPR